MKNVSIAILYICTGQYVNFWEEFYISFEEKFLRNTHKEYFVFTDALTIYNENSNNVHRVEQENLGWPGNTLFRFGIFKKMKEELKKFNYIFFMNANIICVKEITEDMFLPKENDLLMVQHPGWFNRKPFEFEYDRNRKSSAYISYVNGEVYVCGGVNGGKTAPFLELIDSLDARIRDDYNKGIIARWHDESHVNKYIIENKDYRLLSPSFCYPEGWDIPYEQYLLVLDKKKKIKLDDRKVTEQTPPNVLFINLKNRITKYFWTVVYLFNK